MWITNAAVPLGVPSIERDGHPFFGFWKNRTPTPNSTLIYRFCFAAFEEFFKRHFTSNLRFTDSELVLIDHRNRTCYLWFSEKPAFGCYDTSWVSDSLGSISTKRRMCSKIYPCIMNYTVWPRWSPNGHFMRKAIDYWRPMGRQIYITTLRCLVVQAESKNIHTPCSENLQKLANLKALQSLSKWTPKRMTSMSLSKKNVRWPALRSVLGPILPILSCFLSLRSLYFHAITDWDQSGNYRQLLVFSAILIT